MVDADVVVIVNIIVITVIVVNVNYIIAIKKVFLECFRKGI